jgi:hypothetical protein
MLRRRLLHSEDERLVRILEISMGLLGFFFVSFKFRDSFTALGNVNARFLVRVLVSYGFWVERSRLKHVLSG